MQYASICLRCPSMFYDFKRCQQKIRSIVQSNPHIIKEIKLKDFGGLKIVDTFEDNLYFKFKKHNETVAIQCATYFHSTSYKKICYVNPLEEFEGGVTYCKSILLKQVMFWSKYNLWAVLDGSEKKLAAICTMK